MNLGLPVMDLGVAGLVDFVLGCGFCAVGLDGSWWVFVESLARGGLGWVARCFLVGLWDGSRLW
jgi:hypothetical protein